MLRRAPKYNLVTTPEWPAQVMSMCGKHTHAHTHSHLHERERGTEPLPSSKI